MSIITIDLSIRFKSFEINKSILNLKTTIFSSKIFNSRSRTSFFKSIWKKSISSFSFHLQIQTLQKIKNVVLKFRIFSNFHKTFRNYHMKSESNWFVTNSLSTMIIIQRIKWKLWSCHYNWMKSLAIMSLFDANMIFCFSKRSTRCLLYWLQSLSKRTSIVSCEINSKISKWTSINAFRNSFRNSYFYLVNYSITFSKFWLMNFAKS